MAKEESSDFYKLLCKVCNAPNAQRMKLYLQHGRITTYEHCVDVARLSYGIAKKLHLGCKTDELVRGAFLHDYFLYDWHHHDEKWHGYTHAKEALKNAARDFDLTPREKNIIGSHMWPLNLLSLPKCREAWVVCIADKIVSAKETIFKR